eukprot:m.27848 g.27848  ORF g.27848 m.27848 type:complete len:123 (+) comp10341_c0_seq1:147-515(+)
MGANTSPSTSLLISLILAVLTFASMQIFSNELQSSEIGTILAGFVSSILYVWVLTAINNFECTIFGSNYQAGLIPECLFAMFIAMSAAATIHGVSVTTCFLFSCVHTFFLQRFASETFGAKK